MIITNLNDIKNKDYEILGVVEGSVVYSKHFGKDFMSGLKNMVGGELHAYTEMIEDAKKLSLGRLKDEAFKLNADAILNLDYSMTNLQTGSALVINVIGQQSNFYRIEERL